METIKIPELGIEVTRPIKWTKPIKDIKVSKNWRIIEKWQLWFILDGSKYMDKFLGEFKGKWNLFYCAPTNHMKINKIAGLSRLDLDKYLDLGSNWDWNDNNLSYSYGNGKVVFYRDLTRKK